MCECGCEFGTVSVSVGVGSSLKEGYLCTPIIEDQVRM
jgi:hypothetical protein